MFDCMSYERKTAAGYWVVYNHVGNHDIDIAINASLHGYYGTNGWHKGDPEATDIYTAVQPTNNANYQLHWTLRRQSQLDSSPDVVPNFIDGQGCANGAGWGGSIFDKCQRGIPTQSIRHGWSSSARYVRSVVWVDGHAAAEQPRFQYQPW